MSDSNTVPLPDYEDPAVIEVVCGVQFEPLTAFQATAFGLFWNRVRGEYPKTEEVALLNTPIERIGEPAPSESPRPEVLSIPPLPRMFFVDDTGNWLIQVQRERFLHNWRRVQADDVYPRYPTVFEKFWNAWTRFADCCAAEHVGPPDINQLEITYINHIPAGAVWKTIGQLGKVFPDIRWRADRGFLPEPESLAWRSSFVLPERQGRLHVSVKHAIRRDDNQHVLLCDLTARGMPKGKDNPAIEKWFALGREWIVRGFADLTDEEVQEHVWRRKM